MTELESKPMPLICCCPNGHQAKDGLIITNAGCRVHGLGVDIAFYASRTVGSSREMQIPASPVRNGNAKWHRISGQE